MAPVKIENEAKFLRLPHMSQLYYNISQRLSCRPVNYIIRTYATAENHCLFLTNLISSWGIFDYLMIRFDSGVIKVLLFVWCKLIVHKSGFDKLINVWYNWSCCLFVIESEILKGPNQAEADCEFWDKYMKVSKHIRNERNRFFKLERLEYFNGVRLK